MDQVDKILAQWNAERPDLDVAPMGLIGRLKRLSLHLTREMEETWSQYGLNFASFDVLATLRRSGAPYALSPSDLIASAMVTSGTMTNRIDQLVKAGLVERKQSKEDKRSFLISLTEKGLELIDKAATDHVANQHRLVSQLSDQEMQELDVLLKGFLEKFEANTSES